MGQSQATRQKRLATLYEMCDNKCAHCGVVRQELGFYDFHHINPAEKEDSIGNMMRHKWEKVLAEVSKCAMLCPNCHRLEHIKLRDEKYDQ
jgi:phage FluMu protein Com